MNPLFIVIFITILLFYSGLTYYIGIQGLWFITATGLNISITGYWIILWFIAFSFIIARFWGKRVPNWLNSLLDTIGAYWMAIMTYLIIIMILVELAILLNNRIHFLSRSLMSHPNFTIAIGFIVVSIIAMIISYGRKNALNFEVVNYEVQLQKKVGLLQEIDIVMISDLHLGKFVNRRQLERIVEEILCLNPDLIVMPGDIIDDRVDVFVEENMMEVFQRLNPPLGIYASMGNHEYIGGQVEKAEKYFKKAGITVLRDQYVKIKDAFYVVGREDKAYERFQGNTRKKLMDLLQNANKKLPIIMLDHQPVDITEAKAAGVDMQLSGHTHRGQLFPFRMITKKIFEVDWGYKKIDDIHVIVTSGVGTWGPPIRVGHRSEIAHIKVKF